jgi:hypothetical protein
VTTVQETQGKIVGDVAAQRAFLAEITGPLETRPGVVQGLAVPTSQLQRVAEVAVGADDGLGIADLLGDPAGFQVQGDRSAELAEVFQAHPKDCERVGFLGLGPDRAGDRDRFLTVGNGSLVLETHGQRPSVAGEDAGVLGRGRCPCHQPFRSLEGGQHADLIGGDPAVVAQAGQQLGGPDRVGVCVHPAKRILDQLDRSLGGAAEGNRLGRPG